MSKNKARKNASNVGNKKRKTVSLKGQSRSSSEKKISIKIARQ